MKHFIRTALCAAALSVTSQANAATYILDLQGQVANITNFQQTAFNLVFDRYFLSLSGLDSGNAITVVQGDEIQATVTLDQVLSISASQVRTDLLQFFFGSNFTGNETGVTGTFNFYNGGNLVTSLAYGSSTSSQLASFGILFPPDNGPFAFDSFTNDVTITTLDQPAILDATSFSYNLVSNAVPEPATWGMMILGFGMIGSTLRRRAARTPAAA